MSEKCGTLCKHGFLEAVCERCKMADQIAAMTKERDEWKAKAEANERDAGRYLAEIEMCAKRIFNRMYGSLPLGRRGKEFAQQEYDNLCRVLRNARSAEKEKE